MDYYIYEVDLDIMDSIKDNFLSNREDEKSVLSIKTNGTCLLHYTYDEFNTLINEIGYDGKLLLDNGYLVFEDVKKLYNQIKLDNNKTDIRDFKLNVYKAITNCHGLVVLKYNEEITSKIDKKWYEFWKKC